MKLKKSVEEVMNKFNVFRNKKGIASEFLPWLLIAIAVLAIVMITMFLLRGQGTSLIDKMKGLFGP